MAATLQNPSHSLERSLLTRSRERRISKVLRVSKVLRAHLCIGLCLVATLLACSQAHGSCGDYLQHGPFDSLEQSVDFQGEPEPLGDSPTSRCRYGNCNSLPPVDLLTGVKFRLHDRNSDMVTLRGATVQESQVAFGRASDEDLRSQTFLEVTVPPPKS